MKKKHIFFYVSSATSEFSGWYDTVSWLGWFIGGLSGQFLAFSSVAPGDDAVSLYNLVGNICNYQTHTPITIQLK